MELLLLIDYVRFWISWARSLIVIDLGKRSVVVIRVLFRGILSRLRFVGVRAEF